MSSPSHNPAHGLYTGTGAATAFTVKLDFKPKYVCLTSAEGQAKKHDRSEGIWKQTAAGAASVIAAGVTFDEFGFTVASTDDQLNKVAVKYSYEAY